MILEGVFALEAQSGSSRHIAVFNDSVLLEHIADEISAIGFDAVEVYEGLGIRGENEFQSLLILRGILSYVLELEERS